MIAQASGYHPPEGFHFDLEYKKRQVSSLLYAMREKVDNIIDSFRLSDDHQNSYATVRSRL